MPEDRKGNPMSSEAKKALMEAKEIAFESVKSASSNMSYEMGRIVFKIDHALSALEAERGDELVKLVEDAAKKPMTKEDIEDQRQSWIKGELGLSDTLMAQPHPPAVAGDRAEALDAKRYRRLRILGVAPAYTKHLEDGNVMRFTNLDDFVDGDLSNYVRGEAALTQPNADLQAVRDALASVEYHSPMTDGQKASIPKVQSALAILDRMMKGA